MVNRLIARDYAVNPIFIHLPWYVRLRNWIRKWL
jgi:hypothetical protein